MTYCVSVQLCVFATLSLSEMCGKIVTIHIYMWRMTRSVVVIVYEHIYTVYSHYSHPMV